MAPYDADYEDWDHDSEYEGLDEDRNILRRGRQALGLNSRYVPSWKPGHAIREFYQNW
jgi:hypothetical protein